MKTLLAALAALSISANLWAAATQDSRTKTTFTNIVVTGTAEVDGALTVDGLATHNGPILPYSRTLAQINALAATSAGQIVVCSNCTSTKICVSSGTSAGAWTLLQSSATEAGVLPVHCQ